jgi:hypothetical protein
MLDFEDQLRESLRARAEALPISRDLLTRIENGSRRRHRRRVGLVAAAIVAVIAVGAGVLTTFKPATTDRVTTAGLSGAWSELPLGPLGSRSGQYSVWTGREMLIWAGRDFSRDPTASPYGTNQFTDGAAYNPTTRRWRRLSEPPIKLF